MEFKNKDHGLLKCEDVLQPDVLNKLPIYTKIIKQNIVRFEKSHKKLVCSN